jgi:hypothetical protein
LPKIELLPGGATGRIAASLVVLVSLSIMVTAALGYFKLYDVTAANSGVRIDRAARAAAALFTHELQGEFDAVRDEDGRPLAIRLKSDSADTTLSFRDQHDALLKEIGTINQGAANLFRFNRQTGGLTGSRRHSANRTDRCRRRCRSRRVIPPIANLAEGKPYLGEVPVMGRMRLAYLTPIVGLGSTVEGALAVDVGWTDDLVAARTELRSEIMLAAGLILLIVVFFGTVFMGRQLKPIRMLARYADDLAENPRGHRGSVQAEQGRIRRAGPGA